MVSRARKVEADPEAWAIMDGKLFVFGLKEAVPIFKQQTASMIGKANDNWQGLHKAR
jgi:hypothetical protein